MVANCDERILLAELKTDGVSFHCVDARSVGNARLTAQVKVVPLLQVFNFVQGKTKDAIPDPGELFLQCWKNGEMLESYLAEGQLSEAEVMMRDIVMRISARS